MNLIILYVVLTLTVFVSNQQKLLYKISIYSGPSGKGNFAISHCFSLFAQIIVGTDSSLIWTLPTSTIVDDKVRIFAPILENYQHASKPVKPGCIADHANALTWGD